MTMQKKRRLHGGGVGNFLTKWDGNGTVAVSDGAGILREVSAEGGKVSRKAYVTIQSTSQIAV